MNRYLILLTVSVFISCSGAKDKNDVEVLNDLSLRVGQRIIDAADELGNLKLSDLCDDLPLKATNLIMFYNSQDCHSCIDIGEILIENIIQSDSAINVIFIKTDNRNIIKREPLKLDIPSIRYNQENLRVYSKLMSLPSPFLLAVDDTGKIAHSFFPISGLDQSTESNEFKSYFLN